MIVNNGISDRIVSLASTGKAEGDYDYLAIGKVHNDAPKDVFIVKREGERSWGAYALTDVPYDRIHIKGNSGTILSEVAMQFGGGWNLYKISKIDKTTLRKAIMEAICYGTVKTTEFKIEKVM